MSHKDVWNMIVNSREYFPREHLLHDLDVMVLCTFMFLCLIGWIGFLEWWYCKDATQEKKEPSMILDFFMMVLNSHLGLLMTVGVAIPTIGPSVLGMLLSFFK